MRSSNINYLKVHTYSEDLRFREAKIYFVQSVASCITLKIPLNSNLKKFVIMLACQKDKFSLPDHVSYLNCAYFSPLLNRAEQIGYEAVSKKKLPYQITIDDFFEPVERLKTLFAKLIETEDFERIAMVPGVSYGMTNVINNITLKKGENIVIAAEQFPSNVYPWMELVKSNEGILNIISPDKETLQRGESWNDNIVEAINYRTRVVALANVHWTDGTLFDLIRIRKKCHEHGALLIIDGSQSIGALPFSVKDIRPDALICAGYKWLLGPYSLGLAYYGNHFDNGNPIEHTWINKADSEDFQNLANYTEAYKPKAYRYNVSENSNFVLVPMLTAGIEQILEWKPDAIQDYCHSISHESLLELSDAGCLIEDEQYRGNHLFGIRLNDDFELEEIKKTMEANDVYVSFRGNAIRVSAYVFNTKDDFKKLTSCILEHRKRAIY